MLTRGCHGLSIRTCCGRRAGARNRFGGDTYHFCAGDGSGQRMTGSGCASRNWGAGCAENECTGAACCAPTPTLLRSTPQTPVAPLPDNSVGARGYLPFFRVIWFGATRDCGRMRQRNWGQDAAEMNVGAQHAAPLLQTMLRPYSKPCCALLQTMLAPTQTMLRPYPNHAAPLHHISTRSVSSAAPPNAAPRAAATPRCARCP